MTTLEASELKGLGGAGFPAGRKWRILREQHSPRLLAVNIDEGEPGTFKDRYYLESDPHRFFEGMLIASKVVGIDKIYIYLRDEYPAVKTIMEKEIEKEAEFNQFDEDLSVVNREKNIMPTVVRQEEYREQIDQIESESQAVKFLKGFKDILTNSTCLLYTSPSPRDDR